MKLSPNGKDGFSRSCRDRRGRIWARARLGGAAAAAPARHKPSHGPQPPADRADGAGHHQPHEPGWLAQGRARAPAASTCDGTRRPAPLALVGPYPAGHRGARAPARGRGTRQGGVRRAVFVHWSLFGIPPSATRVPKAGPGREPTTFHPAHVRRFPARRTTTPHTATCSRSYALRSALDLPDGRRPATRTCAPAIARAASAQGRLDGHVHARRKLVHGRGQGRPRPRPARRLDRPPAPACRLAPDHDRGGTGWDASTDQRCCSSVWRGWWPAGLAEAARARAVPSPSARTRPRRSPTRTPRSVAEQGLHVSGRRRREGASRVRSRVAGQERHETRSSTGCPESTKERRQAGMPGRSPECGPRAAPPRSGPSRGCNRNQVAAASAGGPGPGSRGTGREIMSSRIVAR